MELICLSSEKQKWVFEQKQLSKVLVEIDQQERNLLEYARDIKDSVVQLRRGFWDDVTVNIENIDEMIETYASIKQQAELLSERERSHGQLATRLNQLKQLKDSPYFGRIDFQEEGEETETIYIGRASLMDENEENFLVYDWRAPIASMYYDYGPGPAQYETLEGTITGEVALKRQYIIEKGILKGMFDTGLTIGDHLLQKALSKQASTAMKSIVATIQREQNEIIRNEKSKYLIVQGVAGSGKTSAALQRVAYLMYRHRGSLHEKNMMLFSPNALFNSYVANVLPELGEENIHQTTFIEHVEKNITIIDVESPFDQMEFLLTGRRDDEYQLRIEHIRFKSSLAYKEVLDAFIDDLHNDGMLFHDLFFRDELFISGEEIKNYFYSLEQRMPIANRMELVARWLKQQIVTLSEAEIEKDWVRDKIDLLDDEQLTEAYHTLQEQADMEEFYDSGKEEEFLRKQIVQREIEPLEKIVTEYHFVKIKEIYEQLFTSWKPKQNPSKNWNELCTFAKKQFQNGWLTWEEATPFLYFQGKILGERTNRSIRHIIIDEAQDYTPFQIAYLKHIYPHTHMTILGDLNQAIYAQTKEGNPLAMTEGDELERVELTKSYRSTKQIVQFTSHFAPESAMIQPFERNGEKPKVIKVSDRTHFAEIKAYIEDMLARGHETIGVICKTRKESQLVEKSLAKKLNVHRIDETKQTFEKGVLILPIYLAKGIEFDVAVIPDASSTHYSEKEQTLFYTACTRAMHELLIFSSSDWCPFVQQVGEHLYDYICK